jgi:hypothetical protein
LGRNSWECFAQTNICQSYYYYPYGYGGESIRQYFATQGTAAPTYSADIINNYAYLNNCFSNGHAIDNFNLRSKNMAELFAAKIKLSANDPKGNCATTSVKHEIESELQVYPNPTNNQVNVICNANAIGSIYQVFNQLGITLITGKLFTEQNTIDLSNLPDGLYFIYSEYSKLPFKIVKN